MGCATLGVAMRLPVMPDCYVSSRQMIRTVGRGPWKIRTRQYQVPHRQRRPHGEHDRVPPQRAPDVPARRPTATGTAMMRFEGADGAPTSTVTGS